LPQLPHSGGRRSRPEKEAVGAGFGGSAAEPSTNSFSREGVKPAPRPWQGFASSIFKKCVCGCFLRFCRKKQPQVYSLATDEDA
jgi:hypothetical protein